MEGRVWLRLHVVRTIQRLSGSYGDRPELPPRARRTGVRWLACKSATHVAAVADWTVTMVAKQWLLGIGC